MRKRARGSPSGSFATAPATRTAKGLKSIIAGTLAEFSTESAIRAKLNRLVLAINSTARPAAVFAAGMLLDRFIEEEHLEDIIAGRACGQATLRASTAHSYLTLARRYIRPRWGIVPLSDVRPPAYCIVYTSFCLVAGKA